MDEKTMHLIDTLKNQVITANHLEPWVRRIALDVLYKAVNQDTLDLINSQPESEIHKNDVAKILVGANPMFWNDLGSLVTSLIEELVHVGPDPEPSPETAAAA